MKTKHIGQAVSEAHSPNQQLTSALSQLQAAGVTRFEPPPPPTLQPNKLATATNLGLTKLKTIKTTTNGITLINSPSSTSPSGRLVQTPKSGTNAASAAHQALANLTMNMNNATNANAVRIKLEQQQQQLGSLIAAVTAAGNKSLVRLNGGAGLTVSGSGGAVATATPDQDASGGEIAGSGDELTVPGVAVTSAEVKPTATNLAALAAAIQPVTSNQSTATTSSANIYNLINQNLLNLLNSNNSSQGQVQAPTLLLPTLPTITAAGKLTNGTGTLHLNTNGTGGSDVSSSSSTMSSSSSTSSSSKSPANASPVTTNSSSHPTTIAELTKQINAQRAASALTSSASSNSLLSCRPIGVGVGVTVAPGGKPATAKSLTDTITALAKFNQETAAAALAVGDQPDEKAQIMSKIILSKYSYFHVFSF